MSTTVPFGKDDSVELSLGAHTVLAPNVGREASLDDPAGAMRAALATPLGYPPLRAAVVPGDRVTIALGGGIPQLGDVLRGAIEELLSAGVDAQYVTVLSVESLNGAVADRVGVGGIRFETHNPDDANAVAMVGMTAAHLPLRLNRSLTEADFVLPIAAARAARADEAPAKFLGLFPRYSNRETAERLTGQGRSTAAQRQNRQRRSAEADEAAWLLGVAIEALVVPGPGGGVSAVIAGEPTAATQLAAKKFQAIWERPAATQGDLVIASVVGDAAEQTWGNLARAVAASEKVVSAEGAIAVCCELDQPPGGSFERLLDVVDFGVVSRQLRGDSAHDARPAMILARALGRGPVYLRSRLPADVVESLGMTPIESDAELTRLASGRQHCVVIEEAQRVRPRVVGARELS